MPDGPFSIYATIPVLKGHSEDLQNQGIYALSYLRSITGFHQDEHGDWVADLECGHTQHVRHRPPWQVRPWVVSQKGRDQHLGQMLSCKKCQEETP